MENKRYLEDNILKITKEIVKNKYKKSPKDELLKQKEYLGKIIKQNNIENKANINELIDNIIINKSSLNDTKYKCIFLVFKGYDIEKISNNLNLEFHKVKTILKDYLFSLIYVRYYEKIKKRLKRKINENDIEDLIHNIFVNLYKILSKDEEIKNIEAYLFTIARNEINTYYKRKGNILYFENEDLKIVNEEYSIEFLLLDKKEMLEYISKKINNKKNKEMYLKVLNLIFEKCSIKEISEKINISLYKVYSILNNIRIYLKNWYK